MIWPAVRRVLDWWLGELCALVPTPVRAALRGHRRIVLLETAEGTLVVREISRRVERTVDQLPGWLEAPPEALRALARRLARYRYGGWQLGLRIDDDRILRDRLVLPAAAAENLREIVGLQIERVTPFALDEIVFDCRRAGAASSDGRLAVEFVLAPTEIVRRPLDRLAQAGIAPRFVAVGDEILDPAHGFDLLAGADSRRSPAPISRLNAALTGVMALLVAALVWLPIERERHQAELAEARLADLRRDARESERLMQELKDTVAIAGFLRERKRAAPSMVRVIDDLSALLPDESWVTELRVRGGNVQIAGQSPTAADVLGLIERSLSFGEARLVSPITRDPSSGRERFNLSFRAAAKVE